VIEMNSRHRRDR